MSFVGDVLVVLFFGITLFITCARFFGSVLVFSISVRSARRLSVLIAFVSLFLYFLYVSMFCCVGVCIFFVYTVVFVSLSVFYIWV